MPRADNVPSFKLGYKVTPCPHNPLGVKGCGEAGAIAAPAAVMNAVHDALAPVGVKHVEMPATPLNVWQAIQAQRQREGSRVTGGNRDVRFRLSSSEVARRRGRPAEGQATRPAPMSGGMTLIPTLKQRLAQAERRGRSRRHQGTGRHQGRGQQRRDRRHDPPCRRRDLGRRQGGDPGAGLSRRPYRRSAGAQPRHDRRLGRQQRSGGRLSGGGRGAQCHGHHQHRQDRGRRLLQGPVRDGA